jgi:hypothetical protein
LLRQFFFRNEQLFSPPLATMPKKLFDALDDAISAAPTPPSPLLKSAVVAAVAGGDGAGNNTIVEVLALTGTASLRLTDADVAVLVEALTQAHGDNVFLRTLSLRNHRITDDGFALICQKLVLGPPGGVGATLRALDLEGNDIEGKGVGDLRLESLDCHLEALNLRCPSTAEHHNASLSSLTSSSFFFSHTQPQPLDPRRGHGHRQRRPRQPFPAHAVPPRVRLSLEHRHRHRHHVAAKRHLALVAVGPPPSQVPHLAFTFFVLVCVCLLMPHVLTTCV